MSKRPIIVWIERTLRLADHPALQAAWASGAPVVPVFVWTDSTAGGEQPGAAARWWLHHSLAALATGISDRGGRLVIRRGEPVEALPALVRETGAAAVYWTRRYEPEARRDEARLRELLVGVGVGARRFAGALLHEPEAIANRQGGPFKVFTPFWRHCCARKVPVAISAGAGAWPAPERWPTALAVEELELRPRLAWADGFAEHWTPGEQGAQAALRRFVKSGMEDYADQRDQPGVSGTSRLSPHLHWGEISPRQVWAAVAAAGADRGTFPPNRGAQVFLSEVGWREFAHHLLFHFPDTTTRPLREEFARFGWRVDPGDRLLRAWQRGQTGYPIVDAGMRELWATGWMHNRVRMIAASFLVKHLRLPWQRGAAWFGNTLVDADLANNTLGWQWTAGCGADAAPYFRIFNPMLQGAKFDGQGDYVRHWVPEVAALPNAHLHCPWNAPAGVLEQAGIVLGESYPAPMVDHATARAEALAAYRKLRT